MSDSRDGDLLAVFDLFARYQHATDVHDTEATIDLFTPDGVLDNAGRRAEGHEALRDFLTSWTSDPAYADAARGQHFFSLPHVVVDGDGATARSTMIHVRPGSPATIGLLAEYDDRMRRGTDGTWRFEERRITPVV